MQAMKLAAAAALSLASSLAAAETYEIEPTHTFARASYLHLGLSTAQISFNQTTGTLTFDPAAKTGAVDISIAVDSVNTGVEKFDNHLKSEELFDAAKFPTITFKSSAFVFTGDQLTAVNGDLTVHGVTKPVSLKVLRWNCRVHPMRNKPACGADAEATIKRSDFGVGYAAPAVSDEVTLQLQVEAIQK